MPLIKVQSSIAPLDRPTVEAFLTRLSAHLAKQTGKPESYVMTAFEPEVAMTFGGTSEPVCYIEIKNVGTLSAAQTKAMSQEFSQIVTDALGVSSDRTYIEFADVKGAMWGWNGSTFG